jgi:hypothetical protein
MKDERLGRRVNVYHGSVPLEQILKEEREGRLIRRVQTEVEKHEDMAVLGKPVPISASRLCR